MLDEARFRADGKIEGVEEQGTFVVIDPATQSVERPLDPHRVIDLPSSTADGRIVYSTQDGVWLARADGTGRIRLTTGSCYRPLVSPDSTLALCTRSVPTGATNDEGGPVDELRVTVIKLPLHQQRSANASADEE